MLGHPAVTGALSWTSEADPVRRRRWYTDEELNAVQVVKTDRGDGVCWVGSATPLPTGPVTAWYMVMAFSPFPSTERICAQAADRLGALADRLKDASVRGR
ncbi:hypothetical protein [Nonomuraea sp. NPDC048916]|uniref:hypothetical protein n=1 Tax=Nonomuraea sp. NPDC048916 TaxID=3154232 RepID=UPI0033C67B6B